MSSDGSGEFMEFVYVSEMEIEKLHSWQHMCAEL